MRITRMPNGNLLLQASNEDRREIAEKHRSGLHPASIMSDLLEPWSTNGSFTPFDAGMANPFVGLTSAPCIAEGMSVNDNGRNVIEGNVWWYPKYESCDDLLQLRTKGHVTYYLTGPR